MYKRRFSALTILFFSLWQIIISQEPESIYINGNFNDVEFSRFSGIVKNEFNIFIYYKENWVNDIRITAHGDSIDLDSLLKNVLDPRGIFFIKQGSRQYYLTGRELVNTENLLNIEKKDIPGDSITNNIAKQYFGAYSYERTLKKVIIGDKDAGNTSLMHVLSGRITSKTTGEPVIGATVIADGTNIGVISDANGLYSLTVPANTVLNLTVSCLGMDKELFIVEMYSSGSLNIEMSEKLIDIQEVIVRSGRHDNVHGMQMGFQRIEMKEIKSIPAVMGERDILKVANMMPGVQTIGEGSAGFNVRGSSSDQNLFLINEIPVLNTGHLFGFFSAFNPDMISDFNLYKSNFPVEYGGRLASVFEVSTRKGNKKEFGARGSVSPVTGSLLLETPIVKDKASFILGSRATYSDWILKRIDDVDISNSKASFYDIMGGIHIINEDKSSWQFFGYNSKDRISLSDINDFRYENLGASLIYNKRLGDKWNIKVSGILCNYENYHTNKEQLSRAYEHEFKVRSQEIKTMISGHPALRHRTGYGFNVVLYNLDQGVFKPYGDLSLLTGNNFGKESGIEYAVYAFDEYSLTDKLTVYGGLRYSFYNYLGPRDIYTYIDDAPREPENITDTINYKKGQTIEHYSGPEYRLSFNYEISPDFSVKFSYNRMRQYLFMLSNTVSVAPTDRWKIVDNYIKPPVSDQFSIGLYKNLNSAALETSAELYMKKGRNIVEYKDGADLTSSPYFETLILQGTQNSYGAEFMVKRNAGRFTGWISYTYSRSLITVDGNESWEKINQGMSYPANYDKPHALNFVGNLRLSRRFSIASNIVYNTGRPITYPTGILYVDGLQFVSYSSRNEYRIPDYFRIDLSVNIEGNLIKNKFAHGSWMFSVYNLTGRRNPYSIYFKFENNEINGYKQSIYGVPLFTVSYNVKLGNYAVE